jgi:hypothetical protein
MPLDAAEYRETTAKRHFRVGGHFLEASIDSKKMRGDDPKHRRYAIDGSYFDSQIVGAAHRFSSPPKSEMTRAVFAASSPIATSRFCSSADSPAMAGCLAICE